MKRLLSLLLVLAATLPARADEGMWLPALISDRIADMQAKGFRLSAEDIYSINQASLKDAVVLFGRGCTGELISDEGLLLTNHHCGYSQIQQHSSVEHDYLRDGFWAMDRTQELPNPGLTVRFLERMEDVTAQVLDGIPADAPEALRDSLVRERSKALTAAATAPGNGLRASVESLYYGNTYYLFVYREFSDVRLVGAPPSSIGKFGGDTDNWMWPRHTGDFSIFRIYADRDNNPAAYSPDNVPYRPKKHFRISIGGVEEGDFTFVYGFPGSTREYVMSPAVRYISEISNPHKINLRTMRLDIQKKHMAADQAVRIQYSSKNAGVANAWKKWQGEMKGIRKMNTVAEKQDFERAFQAWAEGTAYEGLLPRMDSLYRELEPYAFAADYYNESVNTVELVRFATSVRRALEKGTPTGDVAAPFYKDYYEPIDRESFVAVMEEFRKQMPAESLPVCFTEALNTYGSVEAWAGHLFGRSLFTDPERVAALDSRALDTLSADPALQFGDAFREWYDRDIRPHTVRLNREINRLYRDYMRGQMEFRPDRPWYPDANLTLRVAYGSIQGYSPADGIRFAPVSTLRGILEKDNPEIFDYNIPQRLRDLCAEGDFGRWETDGTVPVCFIATNHTSGGNSGSPVINADGNLIGVNFDRVWEGTMSDIVYDPDVCRNISLDIRYVLFIIDKVAGAGHLLEEMEFVE